MQINHFRTLAIDQNHKMNWKLSIQQKLLNFGKTAGSVMFEFKAGLSHP